MDISWTTRKISWLKTKLRATKVRCPLAPRLTPRFVLDLGVFVILPGPHENSRWD
uniref:Uncharacterized protein n=1 Tax=Siphoviridae sp. ctvph17 TaxID=2825724 RepID=A0A8S5UJL6_9CAUD|nr:MAG TPA: hypothetical protein [Siphoviridae sp. ctvph17]